MCYEFPVYVLALIFVFGFLPILIFGYLHVMFMFGVSKKVGRKFWVTPPLTHDIAGIVEADSKLTWLHQKRRVSLWGVGLSVFVLLPIAITIVINICS